MQFGFTTPFDVAFWAIKTCKVKEGSCEWAREGGETEEMKSGVASTANRQGNLQRRRWIWLQFWSRGKLWDCAERRGDRRGTVPHLHATHTAGVSLAYTNCRYGHHEKADWVRGRERGKQIEAEYGIYGVCATVPSSFYLPLCSLCLFLWLSLPVLSPPPLCLFLSIPPLLYPPPLSVCHVRVRSASKTKIGQQLESPQLELLRIPIYISIPVPISFNKQPVLPPPPTHHSPLQPGKRDLLSLLWHKPGRLGAYVLRMLDGPERVWRWISTSRKHYRQLITK